MLFLQPIFLVLLVSSLLGEQESAIRVQIVQPPAHPVNTLATGLVVVEIEIGQTTGEIQRRVVCGEPPFVSSAVDALERWRFVTPAEAEIRIRKRRQGSAGGPVCVEPNN